MVGRVSRRVGNLEAVEQLLAPAEDAEVLLGDGENLAPQSFHIVPVEPPRAVEQARWIDEVLSASLVHVDLEVRPAADERSACAGVIQVDVRQEQRRGALVAERLEQGV